MSRVYVCLDTETGDLNPSDGSLLTCFIAFLDEDFKVLEELDLKLKPNDGSFPIANPRALQVNGINLEAHMANPETITYAEARIKILDAAKRHLKKQGRFSNLLTMCYNWDFDRRWLGYHVLSDKDWEIFHYGKIDPKICVDFLKDCGWLPKDLGTLVSVAEYFQVPKRNAHNAREDVMMMIDAYRALLALMKSKKDGGQTQDLISLLEAE